MMCYGLALSYDGSGMSLTVRDNWEYNNYLMSPKVISEYHPQLCKMTQPSVMIAGGMYYLYETDD